MNIILEEQIDRSTSDRQLLYDIRTEMRTNNTLLTQLLEVLRPIAKDAVPKKAKAKPKSKEDTTNALPISEGSSNGKPTRSSTRHPNKRKTVPSVKHRIATTVSKSKSNSDGSKRVPSASHDNDASKIHSEK